MLIDGLGSFAAALATASQTGIALVESAIDEAIADLEEQIGLLKPDDFDVKAFIPASAFGAADRSPELALHHTRAHRVIKATLDGLLEELGHFRDACSGARQVFRTADEGAAGDLQVRVQAVEALASAPSGDGDAAYQQAVQDNAGAVATEDNPSDEGDQG